MTAALTIEGLHTYYGKYSILHVVSASKLAQGQCWTALLGRNGAGKTTTLRSIMGLTAPRQGSSDDLGKRHSRACRRSVSPRLASAMFQRAAGFFGNLTVAENLQVPADSAGPVDAAKASTTFSPGWPSENPVRGRQLSGGEQEMLSIARALLINPKLLILDEPSQGLAPLHYARGLPGRGADARRGNFRAARRAERPHEP